MTDTGISQHFNSKNMLGLVTRVGPSVLTMRMVSSPNSSNGDVGDAYVGEYIIVSAASSDDIAILGQVSHVVSDGTEHGQSGLFACQATVKLLTTIQFDTGRVSPGVLQSPQVGNEVFAAKPDLVQSILESQDRVADLKRKDRVELHLASLPDADNTPLSFTPEMLFGRHMCIVGTTGAGKSWTLSKLMEECGKHRAKVILFDATGEFKTLDENTYHVYLGDDPNPRKGSRQVSIPYSQLHESDLFAIFKPRGQSQGPKLKAAMKSLKLAKHESSLTLDGKIIKVHKQKNKFQAAYRKHQEIIDDPHADFVIEDLPEQIQNECVYPSRSEMEPNVWGGINGSSHAQCIPLVNRIQDIITSVNLAPIFQPDNKPSLLRAIDAFLKDDTYSILRINLQYLSFDHSAREIITNALGRHILKLARQHKFVENPILVVVDEAHQFLNKTLSDDTQMFPLDSFGIIAKEGRKYAANICLATQRPRDIPEDVLSQMGTMLVHRLINHHDRGVIERASTDMDESAIQALPTLASGEAVIVGVDFPVPMNVRIDKPNNPPASSGPNYQKFWAKK